MKKFLLKLNMAIVFLVVLFANVSFAESDYERALSYIQSEFIDDNSITYSTAYYADEGNKQRNILIINYKTNTVENLYGFSKIEVGADGYIKFYKDGDLVRTFRTKYGYIDSNGQARSYYADEDNSANVNTSVSYSLQYNKSNWEGTTVSFGAAEHDLQLDDLANISPSNLKNRSVIFFEDQETDASKRIATISATLYTNSSGKITFKETENKFQGTEVSTQDQEETKLTEANDENKYEFTVDASGYYIISGGRVHKIDGSEVRLADAYSYNDNEKILVYLEAGEHYYSDNPITIKKSKYNLLEGAEGQFNTERESDSVLQESDDAEWYEVIISWFIRLIGKGIQGLTSIIAGEDLSIDKLVFDQYSRTNLFIFKKDAQKYGGNKLVSGAINSLNEVFNLFSKIAIIIYLIILVYMGIRMLTLSTSAGKQAKYKELLFDWVKGLIILYFFPYVMRYTILLNHAFVTYLYEQSAKSGINIQGAPIKASNGGMSSVINDSFNTVVDENSATSDGGNAGNGDNYMTAMYNRAVKYKRISDAIIWVIMVVQVLQFLIVYLKRLITVIFLIAIFPLVTISYAIDKIGDGKSQAFNNWTKEFILQVFIQSFHAINYVLIMSIILAWPDANWFLKIVGITYIAKGSDILKGLFAQMKGGTGKDGGPLSVAKTMIKTDLAIKGIRSIKNVASRTIGRNSVLGHGVGMMWNARDTAIERRMVRNKRIAAEAYADSGVSFYGDGTVKKSGDIDVNEVTNSTKGLLEKEKNGEALTEEERKQLNRNLEDYAGLSEAELNNALASLNLGDKEEAFRDAVFIAGVHRALNSKKRKTKVEVRKEVDMELKFRTEPTDNSFIKGYLGTEDKEYNDRQIRKLKKLRTANSVEFVKRDNRYAPMQYFTRDEQIDNLRIAMRSIRDDSISEEQKDTYWKTILDAKGNSELENVIEEELNGITDDKYTRDSFDVDRRRMGSNITKEAMSALDSVYRGDGAYTKDELAFYNKVIGDAQSDDDLRRDIKKYIKDNKVQFSLNDFRKAIDVEVINHSHDDGTNFDRMNEAIQHLKSSTDKKADRDILSNLNANFDDLQEGVLPELIERKDEGLIAQEKAKKEMSNLSDIERLGRYTPEEIQYLRDRESELTSKFRKQLARGALTTTAGIGVSGLKIGTETAVAGITTGATSGKSGNMLEDLITIVPTAVSATESTMHKIGSGPARIANSATKKIIGDGDEVPLKTIRQSMQINEKYYKNQAALDKVNRDISEAESKRKELLDKIDKKLKK